MTWLRPPLRRTADRGGLVRVGFLLVVALGGSGCGPSDPEGVIDRETFIDAYVQLRVAALDTDSQRVAGGDRDRILADLGISESDLTTFVEVRGGELEFMRDVWTEVELRLDRTPDSPEAVEGRGGN
ncbi:MAG: hypothetical protein OEN56_02100 [Gemmatimonadota bacterium]|nr:hypothetical protein [Gemmatimonadota bacterium]